MKDRKLVIEGYEGVVTEPSFKGGYTAVDIVFGKEIKEDGSNLVGVELPKWLTVIIKEEIGAAEQRGVQQIRNQLVDLLGAKK